ncbi:MAG: hypothetical protein PHU88_09615 [candidate division Zixibacteria bacterium]|nr:hypothetical protein [candidate division Zixibacteria bacterium]MDD5425338.1 hypothetical protein [candidate division Zixibacteria bacterium]
MMKRKTLSKGLLGIMILALVLGGCSSDQTKPESNFVKEVTDSIGNALVKNVLESTLVKKASAVDTNHVDKAGQSGQVTAIAIVNSRLYAVLDGGVVVYDFSNKSQKFIPVEDDLKALAVHEGKLFVGGANLYAIEDNKPVKTDDAFEGAITSLYGYGPRLMVGTTTGLYAVGIFGREHLFDDVSVTALTADENGLWVGTSGQGLYRWDGENFQKRFLLRDTTLFDSVNTLAFRYQHLYVGTNNGLHIYDGGRWENLTTADGLPSNNVRSIDVSEWVIYAATDRGMISCFNGDMEPVMKLEDMNIRLVKIYRGRVIAVTDRGSILYKSGNVLKTLIEPEIKNEESFISALE